jgi:tetratricopeptide (TPR) repeat protein
LILDEFLRNHSPLVVGYSGWDGDVLMSAIKKRLKMGRLAVPVYWFCYRESSIPDLPWLTNNDDVFFVVPEEPVKSIDDTSIVRSGDGATQSMTSAPSNESLSQGKDPTLPAHRVFDALVQQFGLEAPPLTSNPLDFYAKQLRELLGSQTPSDGEPDTFYSFHTVIGRVERARDEESSMAPDRLQGFRDAMSKADYRGAITFAKQLDMTALNKKEQRDALFVLWDASQGLLDDSQEEIDAYDLIAGLGDSLATGPEPQDLRVQTQVAKAMVNKGFRLGILGRSEEEIGVYDALVRRFGEATELPLRERVATAMFNKGFRLGTLGRSEESIGVYDNVVRRFSEATELPLREQVAKAMVNKGFLLGILGRSEEEIGLYDEVVRRFGGATELPLREQVAKAMVNKGITLGALGRSEEEIGIYDNIIGRFGKATEVPLMEQVGKAMVNKGYGLGTLGRSEEAIAVSDEVVRRFGQATELTFRRQVAMAMDNKAEWLRDLGRNEEAIALFEDALSRLGEAPEPDMQEVFVDTLTQKALTLEKVDRKNDAIIIYKLILARFANSTEPEITKQVDIARERLKAIGDDEGQLD